MRHKTYHERLDCLDWESCIKMVQDLEMTEVNIDEPFCPSCHSDLSMDLSFEEIKLPIGKENKLWK